VSAPAAFLAFVILLMKRTSVWYWAGIQCSISSSAVDALKPIAEYSNRTRRRKGRFVLKNQLVTSKFYFNLNFFLNNYSRFHLDPNLPYFLNLRWPFNSKWKCDVVFSIGNSIRSASAVTERTAL
jgi:hypothetical protein